MEYLETIRRAEAESHTQAYTQHALFEPGSWLAKPVKTVLEVVQQLQGREGLRVLDLGCGVGRNSIPIAQALDAQVVCVDILPLAIEKLQENAVEYGVKDEIQGIVSGIDDFSITECSYDLILAVSALEHMDGPESFTAKLHEMRRGLRPGGILCLIVNSGVTEQDRGTGENLHPQFEVNLPTEAMLELLHRAFEGMEILKQTVVHQEYDIPRETGLAHLDTQVVTFVAAGKPAV